MTVGWLSGRDRRALLVGTLAVALVLIGTRGLPAVGAWTGDRRAAAAELLGRVERARVDVSSLPAMEDSMRARSGRLIAVGPGLLAVDSPGEAGGTLSGMVSSAATTSQVRLGAVQVRTDSAQRGMFPRVAVRADLVGDIRGITHFLAQLEAGPTLLAVRELSITQPEPGAPGDRPEMLRVEIALEGLMLLRADSLRRRGGEK